MSTSPRDSSVRGSSVPLCKACQTSMPNLGECLPSQGTRSSAVFTRLTSLMPSPASTSDLADRATARGPSGRPNRALGARYVKMTGVAGIFGIGHETPMELIRNYDYESYMYERTHAPS
mmetsp:Transcript_10884/g.30439  ORF Transcript_10884/g.30439 Transcript_10884/m.30439 type:complete len:119 (+) Transcript_10884:541-897(+)